MAVRKRKRRSTGANSNRAPMLTVTVVVMCMALALGVRVHSLEGKRAAYLTREQELTEQVAAEKKRSEDLEEYRVYVQTKKNNKKTAKEKLGLVNPDEIILKPEQ